MIVEKVTGARIADLDRKKYLVPGDLTGMSYISNHVYKMMIEFLCCKIISIIHQTLHCSSICYDYLFTVKFLNLTTKN